MSAIQLPLDSRLFAELRDADARRIAMLQCNQ